MSDDGGSGASSTQISEQKALEVSRSTRFIDSEVGTRGSFAGAGTNLIQMIRKLRTLGESTTMSPEVRVYMQNVVVFLRIERGVAGGITPYATVLFEALSK